MSSYYTPITTMMPPTPTPSTLPSSLFPSTTSNNTTISQSKSTATLIDKKTITIIPLIEDVSIVRHFYPYNTNGTQRFYKNNDIVYYRNKFFIATKNTTREPFSISLEWKEIFDVPARYDISSTEPQGLKRPGDRWENPKTLRIYTYIKTEKQYLWVSD